MSIDDKYDEVLVPFTRLMANELHANAGKGDRPGWLTMTPAIAMLEIYYHAAKLQKAVKDGSHELVREYGADVANMAMMLVDVCGCLDVGAPSQQAGRVDEGIVDSALKTLLKGIAPGERNVLTAALAQQGDGEPVAPFIVGNAYRTQAGELVRFVSVHNEGTSYETMADETGVHRYTRRDFGRVTGTAHDYSDPRNTPPLYLHAERARVPDGWKLAMFVLQSGMYAKLPEEERAVCDALVQENPCIAAAPSQRAEDKSV